MPLPLRASAKPPSPAEGRRRRLVDPARLLAVLVAAVVAAPLLGTATPTPASADAVLTSSYGNYSTSPPSFPVPSNARHVAPWGKDTNAGTSASPYRSIQRAAQASPTGSAIVVRGGVYRESVDWHGKALTIQNHPGERVILTGSDIVSGWVKDGSTWRKDNWNHQFRRTRSSDLVTRSNPLAGYPDQVFNNGMPLRQVGGRSQVVPGTFFADYANRRLYIGDNPSGRTIDASTRIRGIHIRAGHDSRIRGITVQRYANAPSDFGAIFSDNAARVTLERVTIRQNASIGATMIGAAPRVTRSTLSDNGQMGLQAHQAHDLSVRNSALLRNNAEGFVTGGTARVAEGAAKVTSSQRVRFYDNMVEANRGHGLWVDEDSHDIHYIRNIVRHNGTIGLSLELSGRSIVASNLVAHNGGTGLSITETADVQVYNNSFYRNGGRHIYLIENSRKSRSSTVPRDLRNIRIRNNILNETAGSTPVALGVEDVTRTRNGHQLGVSLNYNAYRRTDSSSPGRWTGWASYPNAYYNSRSLSEFRSRTGQEKNGWMLQGGADPFFVNPRGNDFGLRSKSTYVGVGLPSSVAAALGLPSGHRPPLGALHLG